MRHTFLKSSFRMMLTAILVVVGGPVVCADILTIELKESETVFSPQVLLRDVAKVKCRSFSDQTAAEAVELRLLDLSVDEETITAQSVTSRLVLAGWSIEEIQVFGAPEVQVSFREPDLLTDTVIEEAALEAAYAFIGGDKEDMSVKLQNVFVQSLPPAMRKIDGLMARVIPPARVVPGRCIMQIQLWDGESIISTRAAAFDIRKRQTVAVATIALTRDRPIDERSVQFERRFVTTTFDELDPSQVYGQRVRSNVVAGTILQARDLQTTSRGSQIIVKKGDLVTAYARVGKLETRLRNVEAMQDAGIGDSVKLMNRESDNLFSGKVIGAGAVRVVVEQ
jgi:flagella basal body P-ring formation protein FlgA